MDAYDQADLLAQQRDFPRRLGCSPSLRLLLPSRLSGVISECCLSDITSPRLHCISELLGRQEHHPGYFSTAQQTKMKPQLGDAGEPTAAQPFVGQFLEPAFDQVQPGARRGRDVQVPASPIFVGESFGDRRSGVRGQVVQHDVHGQATRDGGVDLFEEPQHVGGGVALLQVGEDLAGRDVHRLEQVESLGRTAAVPSMRGTVPARRCRAGPRVCRAMRRGCRGPRR